MPLAVRQAMLKTAPFTETELDYIVSHFTERIIPKKEHLFNAGEICKVAAYCEKGCFRKYFVNNEGEEIVVDFAIEDYWVGDLPSLINRTPTLYNFQALEDSFMNIMPYSDWERLNREIPKFNDARKQKELRSHSVAVEMLTIEKYASSEEKYQKLLQRFPGITNRVAAIHIASYLGIKPESLSRLKRKFAGM
jgi:CRP-like cAMP-binding protein